MTEITEESRKYKHTCPNETAKKVDGHCNMESDENEWTAWGDHSNYLFGVNFCPWCGMALPTAQEIEVK